MGYEFAVASDQTTTTPVTEPVDKARPADAQDLVGNDEIKRRMEASGTVDESGGTLNAAFARESTSAKGRKTTTSANAVAGVDVQKKRVKGSDPPRYEITIKVQLGASLAAGAEQEKTAAQGQSTQGAVNVSAHAKGVFEQRRVVDESELEALYRALDEAAEGKVSTRFPEAKVIAAQSGKWAEAVSQVDEIAAQATGSAAGARSLGSGDAFSLVVDAGVSGGVSASRENPAQNRSVNASLEGSASWKRWVEVKRLDGDVMHVTVGFADASSVAASGGFGVGQASMKGGLSSATSASNRFGVTFDAGHPSFDRDYEALLDSGSPEEARRMLVDGLDSGRFTDGKFDESETSKQDVEAGAVQDAIRLANTQESSMNSTTEVKDGQVISEVEGRTMDRLEFGLGGFGSSLEEESIAAGTVTDGEASLDLNHRINNVKSSTELNPEEFDELIWRAKDLQNWRAAGVPNGEVLGEWMQLRRDVIAPKVDALLAKVDPKGAYELGQVEAIAQFIADVGHPGMSSLRRCIDGYGGGNAIGRELEPWQHDEEAGPKLFRSDLDDEEGKLEADLEAAWLRVTSGAPEILEAIEATAEMLASMNAPADMWASYALTFKHPVDLVMEACDLVSSALDGEYFRHGRFGRAAVDMYTLLNQNRSELRSAYFAMLGKGREGEKGLGGDELMELNPITVATASFGDVDDMESADALKWSAAHATMLETQSAMSRYRDLEDGLFEDAVRKYDGGWGHKEADGVFVEIQQLWKHWGDDWSLCYGAMKQIYSGDELSKQEKAAAKKYKPNMKKYNRVRRDTWPRQTRGHVKDKPAPF